jgi:hypothetical protein
MARQRSQPAPGCPAFGEESVLERGLKGKPPAAGSVRPGLHVRAASGAPVVWWDPVVLALEVEALAPLRHQRIARSLRGDEGRRHKRRKRFGFRAAR